MGPVGLVLAPGSVFSSLALPSKVASSSSNVFQSHCSGFREKMQEGATSIGLSGQIEGTSWPGKEDLVSFPDRKPRVIPQELGQDQRGLGVDRVRKSWVGPPPTCYLVSGKEVMLA